MSRQWSGPVSESRGTTISALACDMPISNEPRICCSWKRGIPVALSWIRYGDVLNSFIELNNIALSGFSAGERSPVGMQMGFGRDFEPSHSGDEVNARRIPSVFALQARNFYTALGGEKDLSRVLRIIRDSIKRDSIKLTYSRVETAADGRDCFLQVTRYIPIDHLRTTDDCGFATFSSAVFNTRGVRHAG